MSRNAGHADRSQLTLICISIAQLIVVCNAAILNVALPSAQLDLHISDGGRQWVITSYTLVFGGLLLLGGRLGDVFGRKRIFLVGLIGFVLASALGGSAPDSGVLLLARALQGLFGALLAPATLSLISLTFPDGKRRAQAFGVFAAITTAGGAAGLLLGGVLTSYLNWRWALFISIPLAVAPVIGVITLVKDDARTDRGARLDFPSAVLATLGLAALVYAFNLADSHGWTAGVTLGCFAGAVVLLTVFALLQGRVREPLLPPRILRERNRAGSYLSAALALLSLSGITLFLTYYLQAVKGYSPAQTGVAYLPLAAGQVIGSSVIAARLLTRVRPRGIMTAGYLFAAVFVLLLTQIDIDTHFTPLLLVAEFGLGVSLGTAFMPAASLGTYGIGPRDAGVASAMINISQQVGGSIGVALLNTLATSSTATYLTTHGAAEHSAALVNGYRTAFLWAGCFLIAGGLVAFFTVDAGRSHAAEKEPAPQESIA
uniref:MFS transporter n=1 Tax=Streptomyces anthocyanicus TaxID=68174 RepID=UPI002F90F7B7|nr:MFS transporter [Streptomyces anthocyanicus]